MRALYMCRFIILMNARSLVTSGKRKAKKLEKPATLPALSIFTHLSFSSHYCATSQSKIEGYDFISISRLHHLNQEKGLLISIHLLHRCCNFTFFISLLLLRILANSFLIPHSMLKFSEKALIKYYTLKSQY